MVLIKDIEAKTGNNDLSVEVVEIGPTREFEKQGKKGRVCTAIVKDESGQIKLSLWNEQIDMVEIDAKLKLTNMWCDEWQDEKKLSTGKFGKIEVISHNEKVTEFFEDTKKPEETDELSKEDVVYPEEFLDSDENI